MALVIVQKVTKQLTSGTTPTSTILFTTTPVVGNLIVAMSGSSGNTGVNTGWTAIDNTLGTNYRMISAYRVVLAGDTTTITPFTSGTANSYNATAWEVSGALSTGLINGHSVIVNVTTATVTVSSVTPTVANCLGLLFMATDNSPVPTVTTSPVGFISDALVGEPSGVLRQFVYSGHKALLVSGTAYAPAITWSQVDANGSDAAFVVIAPSPATPYTTNTPQNIFALGLFR